MIDKTPETTTVECTLPKATVERLTTLASQRRVSVSDLVRDTVRRYLEELDFPQDVEDVQHTDGHETPNALLPDPPILDDAIVAPCDLPLSNPRVVLTRRVTEMLPERFAED